MRKIAILTRKLYRAFKNKDNRKYSISKGYPEDTYFGYTPCLAEKAIKVVRQRTRKWKRKCLKYGSSNILSLS